MLTLTYPSSYPCNGAESKRHLKRMLDEIKREYLRHCCRNGIVDDGTFSLFWFLEFQNRGAPHYHIFGTWFPGKLWLSSRWYEICGTDDDRHFRAGTRIEILRRGRAGTVSYASKYAAKLAQKSVPEGYENVGRFWGIRGCRGVVVAATTVRPSEMLNPETSHAIERLEIILKNMILRGEAEVLRDETDVKIISILRLSELKRLRWAVASIGGTLTRPSMFVDAEVMA